MSKQTKGAPALVFQSTQLDIVDRSGQQWLRVSQIGRALGYVNPDAHMTRLYQKHVAEFTDSMTALVKLRTKGGMQEVRIFSLRGAHLLGMFARTEKAAEFRRWVLDILEGQPSAPSPVPALPSPDPVTKNLRGRINRKAHEIALKQYDTIHAILTATVEDNLACGATEEGCEGYIEKYGDLSDGTVLMNIRDAQELVFSCGRVIDEAATAIAAIKRIEKRSGFNLYPRPGPSKYSNPDFHKHDRMIEEVIDRMVGNDTRQRGVVKIDRKTTLTD